MVSGGGEQVVEWGEGLWVRCVWWVWVCGLAWLTHFIVATQRLLVSATLARCVTPLTALTGSQPKMSRVLGERFKSIPLI